MANLQLTPLNELFGEDLSNEQILPISSLIPFQDHPFQVREDQEMEQLTESIRQNGVLTPIVVRKSKTEKETYEILSGHRRKRAAELAGLLEVPAIVKDLTDEEATILMVDSNLYREQITYSEKAFAYRMKNEAMKKQGKRAIESENTAKQIGEEHADSARTVFRYIRLTYLIEELLQLVDENKLAFLAGVSLSYLKNHEQQSVLRFYREMECLPNASQAELLKRLSKEGTVFYEDIQALFEKDTLENFQKKKSKGVVLKPAQLAEFFPEHTSSEEIEEIIIRLLKRWQEKE